MLHRKIVIGAVVVAALAVGGVAFAQTGGGGAHGSANSSIEGSVALPPPPPLPPVPTLPPPPPPPPLPPLPGGSLTGSGSLIGSGTFGATAQ